MFILLFYNFLLTIFAPLWVPWMLFRTWRRKEQPIWKERTGDYDIKWPAEKTCVWVHAVSVGEVVACTPILKELRQLLPNAEIVLTTTTSSGHQIARDTAKGLYDHLFYFPIDVSRFMAAALQRVRPAVVAIMETELWPNFLWHAHELGSRVLIVNGRISDRSFKRSKSLKFFYKSMLHNVDRCLMQTGTDAERIKALGAEGAEVFGNTKFDQAANVRDGDKAKWMAELRIPSGEPIVVIGSTRGEEEEKFVLDAIQQVGLAKMVVVHAPRHIERVPALQAELTRRGISSGLRSEKQTSDYLILDSYGELDQVYSIADVVIVGGGFADFGGQNLIQPLAQGKPVLHGVHMQNFRDVADKADQVGAAMECESPLQLAENLGRLLSDPDERAKMGTAASSLIAGSVGAAARYAEAIAVEVARFQSSL